VSRAFKVVICVRHAFELWTAPAWFSERLRKDFTQLQIAHLPDYKSLTEEIRDAEVFVGWSLRAEQVAAAKKLRWVHSTAAAVHQLLSPELVAGEIVLTNSTQVHGPVVAEHALALILALAKRLPSAVKLQQRGVWGQAAMWEDRPRPREVAGATLGVVGLGNIGGELVRLARALGMKVLAVREHPEKGTGGADEVYGLADLSRLLREADYVVLAAPLTEKSRGLMNAERLAQMKPDAFLINVSRGALVDEAALAAALQKHTIAGAALDVFATEPLPAKSPLWRLENLLITPHTAAVTERLWERHYELLADNLRRYLAGQPLRGVVDKTRGY
jgi:phosphoglycerate dehydrogenase-like enzyme